MNQKLTKKELQRLIVVARKEFNFFKPTIRIIPVKKTAKKPPLPSPWERTEPHLAVDQIGRHWFWNIPNKKWIKATSLIPHEFLKRSPDFKSIKVRTSLTI